MADCNVSIDKNKLPGVKEVCRDFAVLEDHSLAYNLQEQEIESHLASNVHKNRLVQKDLQVAKKLQEEEDERAKLQNQKHHGVIAQQDNEIALEIQEELVRQEEQQREQEEKDAAIARKLQEREMKDERRRKKQIESNFDEEYFEDQAAGGYLDVDKHTRHKSRSPGRYDAYSPTYSCKDYSLDHYSGEPKRSRYPKLESVAPQSRSRHPEHHSMTEPGHSRHADPYPEHLSRDKYGDRYPEYEPASTGRSRDQGSRDMDRAVKRKERPARPPPPQSLTERDLVWEKEKHRRDEDLRKDQMRGREQDHRRPREWDKPRYRGHSEDRDAKSDRLRQKEKDRHRARARSRDRALEEDFLEQRHNKERLRESGDSSEERRDGRRQRAYSSPNRVFEYRGDEGHRNSRELWDPQQGEGHPSKETGRIVHKVSGSVITEKEFALGEATKGLTKLDLREQELKDMEVARKMQEEEIKASKMHVRAAQVAQDEEIARLLMEQEKKEYKKSREREKEKERERERLAMEKRRLDGDLRPHSGEAVRPKTRDEYDHQKHHNKPARPPQPRTSDYENVNSGYGYPDHPVASRPPPPRPEAAYRGAYHKR